MERAGSNVLKVGAMCVEGRHLAEEKESDSQTVRSTA